jgi:N-acetylglucosaminyldiphosphoundecaprenol N-acetyl-beta-D-mannosaminyltransferase
VSHMSGGMAQNFGHRRVEFLGSPLDLLSLDETLALVENAIVTRKRLQHVVVNVAKIVNMQTDDRLREDVLDSDLINVDGAGVAWGCKLLGLGKVERVAGIDLMERVVELCAKKGYRPYILGAKPEILEKASENLIARFPGLKFAGLRNGYFKPDEEAKIVADIAGTGADCLFIAMPSPHKERFMKAHKGQLGVPFLMGVGGSVDVFAGYVKRAPVWVQNIGMEWFYRMAQEPRRLFYRYFSSNLSYVGLLASALLKKFK